MKILNYKKYPKDKLINKLRKVTLLDSSKINNKIYIYKNADIELSNISVSSILPSQFYFLKASLLKVENIQKALKKQNIDLFNLGGYLSYYTDEGDIEYNLLPIIIEMQKEKDSSINPIIVDGIHRVILARKQGLKEIQVIKIFNVSKDYPFPGFVNPKGWEQVKSMSSPPDSKNKRPWRFPIEVAYKYYRNFSSAFENVGKPRTS